MNELDQIKLINDLSDIIAKRNEEIKDLYKAMKFLYDKINAAKGYISIERDCCKECKEYILEILKDVSNQK